MWKEFEIRYNPMDGGPNKTITVTGVSIHAVTVVFQRLYPNAEIIWVAHAGAVQHDPRLPKEPD